MKVGPTKRTRRESGTKTAGRGKAPRQARNLPPTKPPAREEWDFGKCPTEHLDLCFAYEYARESDWVIEQFKRGAETEGDEFGVCHFAIDVEQDGLSDEEFLKFLDEVGLGETYDFDFPPTVELWLPPGFPEKPFLTCGFDFGHWQAWHSDYWEDELKGYEEQGCALTQLAPGVAVEPEESKYAFEIEWNAPDGLLLAEFRTWLRTHRPKEPVAMRGRSRRREYAADLKALGAYRLLKCFSAPKAKDYTCNFMPYGLYAKLPDWYEAKKRAQNILRAFFRVNADRPKGR